MKDEKIVRYEKPALETYRFAVTVAAGESPEPGGDIDEECDTEFDD